LRINTAITQILNLEKGEAKGIALPMLYSFFAGSAFAFFTTGATSLLLNALEFERQFIPLSFIAAGLIIFAAGKLVAQMQKRLSFSIMLKSLLGFLLVSVFIFLTLLFLKGELLLVVFLAYTWIRIFAYIHALTFWGFLSRLFNIQQAKRLFGLISGGEVIGGIISFLSVPLLMTIIQPKDILIISGIMLLPAFLLLSIITRNPKLQTTGSDSDHKQSDKQKIDKKTNFKDKRYFKLFFLIAFIPIFAQMFIDFIFQVQTKKEFPKPEMLTSFVGIFFGISTVVEFILKTFVSGKLISKYGMKLALLAFPVMLAASLFPAIVFGTVYGAAALFFAFITLGRLFARAIRTSFNDPATQILYQPLPEDERIAFQNKIESGPKAFGGIAAGLFIFLFALIKDLSLIIFSAFLLAIVLFWMQVAVEIYKEYKSELKKVLTQEKSEFRTSKYDLIYNILKRRFRYKQESAQRKIAKIVEKLYPYRFYYPEKAQANEFNKTANLSNSDEAEDRKKAAALLHNFKAYKTEKILLRLMKDNNPEVRRQAVLTAGLTKHQAFFSHLINRLTDPDTKQAAYSAIFEIGDDILPELSKFFKKIDHKPDLQLEIIDIFENSNSEFVQSFLLENIDNPNYFITNKIIRATGKTKAEVQDVHLAFINDLLEKHLNNYLYHCAALSDLKKLDKSEALIQTLQKGKYEKKQRIFDTLAVLYDFQTVDLIREYLESPKPDTRSFALEIANTILSDSHKEKLLPIFEDRPNAELIRLYRLDYPQEKLSPSRRIADIISAERSNTGIYAKAQAIKLLSKYQLPDTDKLLEANLVHPGIIIQEITGLKFNELFPKKYTELVEKFQHGKPQLAEIKNKITGEMRLQEFLKFEIIDLIKDFELFKGFSPIDLIAYVPETKQIVITPEKPFCPDLEQHFYLLLTGELSSDTKVKTYECGEIISTFNSSAEEKFSALFPVVILKAQDGFLYDFIKKYPHFADNFEIQ
jgi:ATP:ADP antiporter, AAA family